MKTYRQHRCDRQHRTARAFVQCAYPDAANVTGRGDYAVFSWCQQLAVTLHASEKAAEAARTALDGAGCGPDCRRRHDVVLIDQSPAEPDTPPAVDDPPLPDSADGLRAEFDAFTARTGWGLVLTRHYLNIGDLDRARQRFQATRRHVEALHTGEL